MRALLSSRGIWIISLVFALGGAGVIVRTFVHTHGMLESAEKKIEDAAKNVATIQSDDDKDGDGRPDNTEGAGLPHAGSAPATK